MRSQVLLCGTAIPKLVAGRDDPKAHHGVCAHPPMHVHIFVVHGVLILVVHLNTQIHYFSVLAKLLAETFEKHC